MSDRDRNFSYMPDLARRLLIWAEGDKSQPFPEVDVIRIGPSSIAITPHTDPDSVVKITTLKIIPIPRQLQVDREFELLKQLRLMQSDLYVTPEPLAFGNDPNFLAMQKLGSRFIRPQLREEDVERIGRGLGAFSADIWERFGCVHSDICIGNYTNELDGRIGVIDIASVVEAQRPEELFCVPLLEKPNISPFLADEFQKRSGVSIDFAKVETIMGSRLDQILAWHDDDTAQRIQADVTSNLAEWREMLESGRLGSHRPSLQSLTKQRIEPRP